MRKELNYCLLCKKETGTRYEKTEYGFFGHCDKCGVIKANCIYLNDAGRLANRGGIKDGSTQH